MYTPQPKNPIHHPSVPIKLRQGPRQCAAAHMPSVRVSHRGPQPQPGVRAMRSQPVSSQTAKQQAAGKQQAASSHAAKQPNSKQQAATQPSSQAAGKQQACTGRSSQSAKAAKQRATTCSCSKSQSYDGPPCRRISSLPRCTLRPQEGMGWPTGEPGTLQGDIGGVPGGVKGCGCGCGSDLLAQLPPI